MSFDYTVKYGSNVDSNEATKKTSHGPLLVHYFTNSLKMGQICGLSRGYIMPGINSGVTNTE